MSKMIHGLNVSNVAGYLHRIGYNTSIACQAVLDQRAYDTRNQIDEDVLDKWEKEDREYQMEEEQLCPFTGTKCHTPMQHCDSCKIYNE